MDEVSVLRMKENITLISYNPPRLVAGDTYRLVLRPRRTQRHRADNMNVRQVRVALLQLVDEVRELRHRVLHAHVLEQRPRAEPDRRLRLPHGRDDGVDDLEREPRAVLDRAAVLVRALVRVVLQELVDEVPVRAVHLDPVEARALDRVLRCRCVPLRVLLDFCKGQAQPTELVRAKRQTPTLDEMQVNTHRPS